MRCFITRLSRLEKGFSQADVQDNTAELGQTLRQAGNKAESTLHKPGPVQSTCYIGLWRIISAMQSTSGHA